MPSLTRLLTGIGLAAFFAVLAPVQGVQAADKLETLVIESGDKKHRFQVEIARTARQQARGLMFRRSLPADSGMLFLYSSPQIITMWMKNTYIPLDMIFIAPDGRIVDIAERTVPLSLAVVSPKKPASAVLEVNGGTASRLAIKPGDRVIYPAFGTK